MMLKKSDKILQGNLQPDLGQCVALKLPKRDLNGCDRLN